MGERNLIGRTVAFALADLVLAQGAFAVDAIARIVFVIGAFVTDTKSFFLTVRFCSCRGYMLAFVSIHNTYSFLTRGYTSAFLSVCQGKTAARGGGRFCRGKERCAPEAPIDDEEKI